MEISKRYNSVQLFPLLAGVLRGDTLAPYLFIIALDYALRREINGKKEQLGFTVIPRKSRRVDPTMKTDFDFADDIALVSNLVEQAQEMLHRVEAECRNVGLRRQRSWLITLHTPR